MARKFGSLVFLTDDEVRSEAHATVRVARALVGKAAYLWELATGSPASDSFVTPQNPQGLHGVDLSGPPWGSAIRHPLAAAMGKKPATATGYGMSSIIGVSSAAPAKIDVWSIWVKPFEKLPAGSIAPYALGELRMTAHNGSAGTSNIDITIENLTMQDDAEQSLSGTYGSTGLVSSTTEAEFTWDTSPYTGTADPALIPLVPGWNELAFTFVSDSTRTTLIDSIAIDQVEKRTH